MSRRALLALLATSACGGESTPVLEDTRAVIPGPGLPAELTPLEANNNLDVIRHNDRIYLAFRTAPSHFASPLATLHVVSSTDELTWTFEASFNKETDLREPRFLSHQGRLFLYFAVLGESVIDFEPQGMMVTEMRAEKDWSEPEWFYEPGFIPWRIKEANGTVYMTTYVGGENIYDETTEPLEIHFLTTTDGKTFTPASGNTPVVQRGGGSETDFAILESGALIAVTRNEQGDAEFGWGSKICRAEPGALHEWRCVSDRRKYDSPLVFKHGEDVWLVARKNLNKHGGYYDLGDTTRAHRQRTLYYQGDYSGNPKRCALWRVDPESLSVTWALDLPSRGDTCFPGVIPLDDGDSYAIYNYSSPIDGPDFTWLEGQLDPTLIYRTVLRFK